MTGREGDIPIPGTPRLSDYIKEFEAHDPPVFQEHEDPEVLLNWQRRLSQIFEDFECPPKYRVNFAMMKLKGPISHWAPIARRRFLMNNRGYEFLPWERFIKMIRKQLYTPEALESLYYKYLDIGQGAWTVERLVVQFKKQLDKLLPWVPSPQIQVRCFSNALRDEFRDVVQNIEDIELAFDLALQAEELIKIALESTTDIRNEWCFECNITHNWRYAMRVFQCLGCNGWYHCTVECRYENFGSKFLNEIRSEVRQDPMWCLRCRSFHTGPCTSITRKCMKCGLVGHITKDCELREPRCWNCLWPGHRMHQCSGDEYWSTRKGIAGEASTSRDPVGGSHP